jgi:tRNA_anti-like
MNRKKIILYSVMFLFLIAAVVAWYVYKEYNRKPEDTALLNPDYSLQARLLIKEFETNDSTAGKKYLDKIIQVDGLVKDIIKDEAGFNSIILGDTASMSSVRCSMDSLHNKEVNRLQKGSHAVIKGICAGFNADELLGSDVILVRCVLVE